MAEFVIKVEDNTRDIKPLYHSTTFTSGGSHEHQYKLNSTTPIVTVPIANIGTIKRIMVKAPSIGITKLTISYNDGAAKTIDLFPLPGGEPLWFPVESTFASQITGMTIDNNYSTDITVFQEVDVRVYGE